MHDVQTERARLAALHGYAILDSDSEPQFDDIVRRASELLDTPIALISLVDEDRQWFKSRIGLDVTETPRSMSFCAHAIRGKGTMVVPDATIDPRFQDNPLVVNDPSIRFYAGASLSAENGHRLGTLCVIDRTPRTGISEEQRAALESLSRQVVDAFEARKADRAGTQAG